MTRVRLALVHVARGELREAHRQAAADRDLERGHLLDEMPTLHIMPAVTALLAVSDGAPKVAEAEARLARRDLSYFDGVTTWVSVPTRLVLAETALLLGERATAGQLLGEARALLDVAPDAAHAAGQCDALADRLRETAGSLAVGRFALTAAELRVLHYLPTNLILSEIASPPLRLPVDGEDPGELDLPQARRAQPRSSGDVGAGSGLLPADERTV